MAATKNRTDLPILTLFNLDPAWEPEASEAVVAQTAQLVTELRTLGHEVNDLAVSDPDLRTRLTAFDPTNTVVFNWCEELPGIPHSDSLVASVLEELGFAYTGADPAVLSLSWHKPLVKAVLEASGVPTPRWMLCSSPEVEAWDCYPAIVKPAYEHCSAGVDVEAVVMNDKELRDRIALVLETYGGQAMVEDFVDGREFHVSLWGNGETTLLPVAEMDFSAFDDLRDRLCTYDSKFTPGSTHYDGIQLKLPALLSEPELQELARVSHSAYQAIGCRDYGRLDIRLRDETFYVLDVNPNADLSADSSMACAAELEGYSHGHMISRLVNLAATRHAVFGPEVS
jgi:D-alanine-D-alanine ligase